MLYLIQIFVNESCFCRVDPHLRTRWRKIDYHSQACWHIGTKCHPTVPRTKRWASLGRAQVCVRERGWPAKALLRKAAELQGWKQRQDHHILHNKTVEWGVPKGDPPTTLKNGNRRRRKTESTGPQVHEQWSQINLGYGEQELQSSWLRTADTLLCNALYVGVVEGRKYLGGSLWNC